MNAADFTGRIMFWIAIGYGAFSLVGTAFFYFPPAHPRLDGKTRWEEFKELDFIGAFLFVAGLTVFLFGLNAGGKTYPWLSGGSLAPLILGLLVLIGAFIYDFTIPNDPLFPWYLFKNFREFSALPILVFVAGMVFFAASALNAQTILYLHTSDPIKVNKAYPQPTSEKEADEVILQIGIYSIPSGAGQLLGGVIIPGLVHKIKRVNYQLTFAVFMQTLFFALAALITPNNLSWLMACQFMAMLPFGWITLNCYTAASLNVPQKDLGVAIGLIGTFRSVGGSIGSVILSSIFEETAAKEVAKRVGKTAMAAGVSSSSVPDIVEAVDLTLVGVPGASVGLTGVSASVFDACVAAARNGYAQGFRVTWLASIPFGVLALVAAFCVKDPSKYFTKWVSETRCIGNYELTLISHVEIHLNKKIGGKFEAEDKGQRQGEKLVRQ